MSAVNDEIRKSKSRLEGFKEVESRMNTRTTRNNKSVVEDPWIIETGAKVHSNSKRPLCQVSLVLDEDDAGDDIEYLRYGGGSGYGGGSHISGDAKGGGGGRAGGADGGGGSGGYHRAYGGDHASSNSSGRTRRPPAWRRAD